MQNDQPPLHASRSLICRPWAIMPLAAGTGLLLFLCCWLLSGAAVAGGTWTALSAGPPVGVNNCLLLSDGTVLGMNGAGQCVKLTPDIHGSYINGTWSSLATMNNSRLFFSSQLLTNGNVWVAGGEDGTGGSSSELYNTVDNTWTLIPPPTNGYPGFSDSISEILPDGNPLVCPVYTSTTCLIYNVAANEWQTAASCAASQDEADWVKLPSDNILTIDAFSTNSEHYVPSLNEWVTDGHVPVPLYDSSLGEIGNGHLLPNGKVFFIGSTTNTAIYTPGSTVTSAGSWAAGPKMVFGTNFLGQSDAPAAMMVNGTVLCCLGPSATYNGPCFFYEYNYTANAFTQVSAPGGGSTYGSAPFGTSMLDLPDGTVLFVGGQNSGSFYVYTPTNNPPLAAGKPVISAITANPDGSYQMTGTGLNGISEGAAYGDDEQMAGNYPLVRLTNNTSGNVYYARTYNWNSTSVMTSNRVVTTEFAAPPNLPTGTYSLVVSAVGNASAPASFTYTNNITITTNNQYGSASTYPFTPTWSVVTNGNLILGQVPSTGAGNFGEFGTAGSASSLTSGGSLTISQLTTTYGTTCSSNYVTCGNGTGPDGSNAGSLVVYTLNGNGCNLTNITVYGGWQDNGRDQQAYTVYYSTVSAPATFIPLTSVSYTPAGVPASTPSATRVTITTANGALLAANVAAVAFSFVNPPSENGWCGYAQIGIYGTANPVMTATNQYGSANTYPFTPAWSVVTNGDLILGQAPGTAVGNFSEEVSGRNVNFLTGGGSLTINSIAGTSGTTCSTNYITCGNGSGAGSNIIYTLAGSPNGYNLTDITVYGGWQDNGREQQAYTIYYSTAAAPATFNLLTNVNYTPAGVPASTPVATRVTIASTIGALATNVAAVEFNFATPASENGYCGYAQIAIYGAPSGAAYVVTNQYGTTNTIPFTPAWSPVTNGDLILGQAPTTATGNFSEEIAGRNVNYLTGGGSLTISQTSGTTSTNYVTCGNGSGAGSTIIYTLTSSATGYNLTNITVYGGWQDNGRDQQAYMVYYSTTATPTTFVPLTTVNYTPTGVPTGAPSATRVTIASANGALLAANVAAVEFSFANPPSENGYCGYAQIAIYGTTNYVPGELSTTPAPKLGFALAGGQLRLSVPPGYLGWVLQEQTNAPTTGLGANWFTIPGSDQTNQMLVPIDKARSSVYFRLAPPQ